jgi:hypothetical protein
MNTTRLLFAIIGFGTFTLAPSYADEPSKQATQHVLRQSHPTSEHAVEPAHGSPVRGTIDQPDGKHPKPRDDGHVAKKIGQAGHNKTEPNHPLGDQLHQLDVRKAATPGKNGPILNKAGNPRAQLAKPAPGNLDVAPHSGAVRSRNATAANVGRVLITSNAKYSAGPLNVLAPPRKP